MKFGELIELICLTDHALKRRAATAVDRTLVARNWLVGMYVVEFEQHGEDRAAYGEGLLARIARQLAGEKKVKGFSETNLRLFRQFYRTYQEIRQTLSDKSVREIAARPEVSLQPVDAKSVAIHQTVSDELADRLPLSWSHYTFLVRIDDAGERRFYELEATQQGWSVRELKRQFDTSLYERLVLSRDKDQVLELSRKGQVLDAPADAIKDPYVLEFLDLEEHPAYSETELEAAIITRLEHFLLELGKGFLFQSRQYRLTFDDQHFWVDLVFYNRLLRCFVLLDLKIGKLTHQDLGQMQMYVNYFDRQVKTDEESPTIGILLCRDKSDAVVEMTLPPDNETIFASRYQLYLPSKAELKEQIQRVQEEDL